MNNSNTMCCLGMKMKTVSHVEHDEVATNMLAFISIFIVICVLGSSHFPCFLFSISLCSFFLSTFLFLLQSFLVIFVTIDVFMHSFSCVFCVLEIFLTTVCTVALCTHFHLSLFVSSLFASSLTALWTIVIDFFIMVASKCECSLCVNLSNPQNSHFHGPVKLHCCFTNAFNVDSMCVALANPTPDTESCTPHQKAP